MTFIKKVAVAVFSLVISLNAFAEDKGFYFGGSLGHASIETIDESEINAGFAALGVTTTSEVDDNDLGWKFYGGYDFNKYIGIELAYVDLGEAEVSATSSAPVVGTASVDAEADGFAFAVVARYPLNQQVDLFGKLGGFVWEVEGGASVSVGGSTLALTGEDDGNSVMFGLGAEYEFNDNIGIRAEWERFEQVANSDVDMFSIGLEYDF